jgi:hypothetical protein
VRPRRRQPASERVKKGMLVRLSAESNKDLIAAYLDAVMRKDSSVVERFFAPEVEYMVNGTSVPDPAGVLPPISADCHAALPWLGLHRGREGVKEFLAHMHRNLEVIAFGPREVISEGNRAAAPSDAFGCMLCPLAERQISLIRLGLSCETA